MKRIGFGIIILAGVWLGGHLVCESKKDAASGGSGHDVTATTTGNHSPATSQKAEVSGSNNTTILAAQGATVNNGFNKEDAKQLASNAAQLAVQEFMRQQNNEHGPEFAGEFPLGYALFSITSSTEVVPFYMTNGTPIMINWKDCYSEMTRTTITLHLPNIFLPPNEMIYGNGIELPRSVGANLTLDVAPGNRALVQNIFGGGPGPQEIHFPLNTKPTISLSVRIVETKENGTVLLLGLKPYPAPQK